MMDYINYAESFTTFCDFVILTDKEPFDYNILKKDAIIFCKTDYIDFYGSFSPEHKQRLKYIEYAGDKYCIDENEKCSLTKKEMCEKIVYHYIVARNLIATIVSVVPASNDKDEYKGGFMFDRLSSLQTGSFCLPRFHSEIKSITSDERLQRIFKSINILPDKNNNQEQACYNNGGFYLKLSKTQMEELSRDEKFGRKYFDFLKKINIYYQEALINLYNILDNLENNTSISTRRLNELSEQTKKIIDELYVKTQFNYLLAVFIVLDFDFTETTEKISEKQARASLIEKYSTKV